MSYDPSLVIEPTLGADGTAKRVLVLEDIGSFWGRMFVPRWDPERIDNIMRWARPGLVTNASVVVLSGSCDLERFYSNNFYEAWQTYCRQAGVNVSLVASYNEPLPPIDYLWKDGSNLDVRVYLGKRLNRDVIVDILNDAVPSFVCQATSLDQELPQMITGGHIRSHYNFEPVEELLYIPCDGACASQQPHAFKVPLLQETKRYFREAYG